jgi:hypothetical protein
VSIGVDFNKLILILWVLHVEIGGLRGFGVEDFEGWVLFERF